MMPPIKYETLGQVLLAIGLALILLLVPGLFMAEGTAALRVLFGWGGFGVVAGFLIGGTLLLFAPKFGWRVRWRAVVFAELIFLVLLLVLHLSVDGSLDAALAGAGGGLVGWAFSQLLLLVFPMAIAWGVAWLALFVAALFFVRSLPEPWAEAIQKRLTRAGRATRGWLGGLVSSLTLRPPQPREDQDEPADEIEDWSLDSGRPVPVVDAGQVASMAEKKKERSASRRKRPKGLPSLDLLKPGEYGSGSYADSRQRAQLLKQTLADFGIPVEVISIKEGPRVTQFGLEPGEIIKELRSGEIRRRRVPVASILRLTNDLALALAAPSLRIEAPVPGRPYVGVEVPNTDQSLVSLRNVLETREFKRASAPLVIGLGRDVAGDPVVVDLARMPHLLIAGATGSGKSVCINALITSLLMNNHPDRVQLLMVDPKMVELPAYNGIPHLLGEVITDTSQVKAALTWLTLEMDQRYKRFSETGVRNLEDYNQLMAQRRIADPLPYIVLVIDELADLMMTSSDDVESLICRLAQLSRATGIHLVLATQRPSVDVLTGLIKANFPARIAFAVTSQTDSRVILDSPGADKLLGSGDMLFMAPDSAKLSRIQGCFVSDREIDAVVGFWTASRDDEGASAAPPVIPWAEFIIEGEGRDEMLEQVLGLLETLDTVSTSLIQRRLRIGHPRAARLMEQLEAMGRVGPDEGGGRSRQVYHHEVTHEPSSDRARSG